MQRQHMRRIYKASAAKKIPARPPTNGEVADPAAFEAVAAAALPEAVPLPEPVATDPELPADEEPVTDALTDATELLPLAITAGATVWVVG